MPTTASPTRASRVSLNRHRAILVALGMLVLALALIGGVGKATQSEDPAANLPVGSDSAHVAQLLHEANRDGQAGTTAIAVYTSTERLQPQQLANLDSGLREAANRAGARVIPTGPQPLTLSQDGSAAMAVLAVPEASATDNTTMVTTLREQLREHTSAPVTVQVTGPAAVRADLGQVFKGANVRLLIATASVVAMLLLLTYRSPILWIVPLLVVGIADQVAAVAATHVLNLVGLPWDESTSGILSVLVFGAGTDYALLLMSRYRDLLRVQENRYLAMTQAVRHTGHAVLLSASTVVVCVLMLLFSLVPSLRALGVASAVGIVVAAFFGLVLLPTVLVLFGRWVFWPVIPRVGQAQLAERARLWRRVGQAATRRPRVIIGATLAVLAAMSAGVFFTTTGLDQADQFLNTPESITASQRLAQSFPGGSADPLHVLTTGSGQQVAQVARQVPGVASATVQAPTNPPGWTSVQVITTAQPGSQQAITTLTTVRDQLHAQAKQAGTTTYVGGSLAQTVDSNNASTRDRWVIVPLIAVMVFLALLVLLRSILAPVILVASVLLTNVAALGTAWWLFTGVFDFPALDADTVLLSFLFLVALGVDYTIFLVVRIRQEMGEHDTRQAMVRALAATGAVITSAGVVLAAVFAVLGVLPLVALAQIGVVICLGVLLDTLVVRTLLVPSAIGLLGPTFWWPRRVSS